ncbi:hypothetical protein [Kutzneria sp. CA-103260]|uniref:hypothetical protein n=1 Tax=Kutzneria sp. CA-103260 TaxID=2802641 RepID=UPI001BA606C9|nr:hypothetical protein [Kutzneria sp. CA-103260]QUQ71657.1 hypothetical protein JJ691_94440 [Kutzneria sp. CA-103260]
MDPILVSIAGAVAKEVVPAGAKALGQLVQRVKEKFANDRNAELVLASARKAPDNEAVVDMLAQVLDNAEQADPGFGAELRTLWETARAEITVTNGGDVITNTFTGNVTGTMFQVGKIKGGIHDHRP